MLLVSKRVLDSSVLLALLLHERYDAAIWEQVVGSFLSSVSLAEVLTRLIDRNVERGKGVASVFSLLGAVIPFSESHARTASDLRRNTQQAGLSLGDRACLALAIELGAEVYTADRAWAGLDLPCVIHLIR